MRQLRIVTITTSVAGEFLSQCSGGYYHIINKYFSANKDDKTHGCFSQGEVRARGRFRPIFFIMVETVTVFTILPCQRRVPQEEYGKALPNQ